MLAAMVGVIGSAIAASALAAPVTFNVTPTIGATTPGGAIAGFKAYRDCVQATQVATTLIGPAVSGTPFSFSAEPTPAPVVCVRAFNAAGEGGFNAVPLTALQPPGTTTTTYTCTLSPVEGGVCTPG